jgi:hypothetical protein
MAMHRLLLLSPGRALGMAMEPARARATQTVGHLLGLVPVP